MRPTALAASAAAFLAAAATLSCGDGKSTPKPDSGTINPDAGGGEQYAERPGTEVVKELKPDWPGRGFEEVYGIFGDKTGTFGCAGMTCHLAKDGEPIVSHGGDLNMDTVVSACSDLVSVDVREAPGKKRVVPGSLTESYLWCKLTTTSCMVQEPRGAKMFPIGKFYLDVVQSWIENGAHCP